MQIPDNDFRIKTITRGDKVFTYQGFEDAGIDTLINSGYKVEDILTREEILKNSSLPVFIYIYNGTVYRHYPSLAIWSKYKFIEVRSEAAYSLDTERIHIQARAVKCWGFDIEIWVYTSKKELVNIIKV